MRVWMQIHRLNMKRDIVAQNKRFDVAFSIRYSDFKDTHQRFNSIKSSYRNHLNQHTGKDQNVFFISDLK
jgi:type III secretory pathway component EscR